MRNVLSLLLIMVMLSCSPDHPLQKVELNCCTKLQLVSTAGEFPNSATSGFNMPWQEYYLLNADSTFTKTRTTGSHVQSAEGKYHYLKLNGVQFLKFKYPTDDILIGSCYGDSTELLFLKDNNIVASTWNECDGPSLVYKCVK